MHHVTDREYARRVEEEIDGLVANATGIDMQDALEWAEDRYFNPYHTLLEAARAGPTAAGAFIQPCLRGYLREYFRAQAEGRAADWRDHINEQADQAMRHRYG